MDFSPALAALAKSKGSKKLAGTAVPGEPFTRPDEVVDLLTQSTSPAAQPDARAILQAVTATSWKVIRGAHSSSDDVTPHVTIAL